MSDHSNHDHDNSANNKKSFGNKFVFPLLIIACLFFLFSMITKNNSHNAHGDSHGVESTDGQMESEEEHHDHEDDHGHHDHEH